MKSQESLAQDLDRFARTTLSQADASDQDIVDFVKMLGLKLIQGKQKLQQVKKLLEEIVKEQNVVNKFLDYFTSERAKVEEEQAQNKQSEKLGKGNEEPEGKIIVNKSQSDVPAIYRQMEEKRNKQQNQRRQDRSRDRKKQQRSEDRNNQRKANDKKSNTNSVHKHQKREVNTQGKSMQSQEKTVVQLPDLQGKSKCKFFPFCTNENCEFFHPTEKCSRFPRCSFKERCLFMHQACKFAESCTRSDCFYDHPFNKRKSNDPLMNMMKMMMAANKSISKPKRAPKPQTQQSQNQG